MAKAFGIVPAEVAVIRSTDGSAPGFVRRVRATLAELEGGRTEFPFEWRRFAERQSFLYGFGRTYDDGRGKVTGAATVQRTWHGYGLAVDVVEKDATPWDAPMSFWEELGEAAERNELAWGGRWHKPDWPHLQPAIVPVSPTDEDWLLLNNEGAEAVWLKYGLAA